MSESFAEKLESTLCCKYYLGSKGAWVFPIILSDIVLTGEGQVKYKDYALNINSAPRSLAAYARGLWESCENDEEFLQLLADSNGFVAKLLDSI